MNRKSILFFVIILAGVILFAAGWFLMRGNDESNHGNVETDPFTGIELSVMSGDISIVEGDSYSVSYSLHGREKVKRAEVVDGTLYFDTGFNAFWRPGYGDWRVTITVPAGTEFDTLNLSSTAGDIELSGYVFENGSFHTTSGNVTISDISCESIDIRTVSHNISLDDSMIASEARLETVSGKISVASSFERIESKSIGKIWYNGENQGSRFSIGDGKPELHAESVSGKIELLIR